MKEDLKKMDESKVEAWEYAEQQQKEADHFKWKFERRKDKMQDYKWENKRLEEEIKKLEKEKDEMEIEQAKRILTEK